MNDDWRQLSSDDWDRLTPEERMYLRRVQARHSADRVMLVTGKIWRVISLTVCLVIFFTLLFSLILAESGEGAFLSLFLLVLYCGFFVWAWSTNRDGWGRRPTFWYWITHP